MSEQTAVLLIAHGSRRDEANHDLVLVAKELGERTEYEIVVPSYLELAAPNIPDGAAECVRRGARRVLMLPYFLSAGSHVVDDLEHYRKEIAAAHAEVEFQLCPPLGRHPLMIDIIQDRLRERLG